MTTIQALTNKLWEQKKSCLFFQHFPTKINIAIPRVVSRTLRVRDSRIYIAILRVVSCTLRVRDSGIYIAIPRVVSRTLRVRDSRIY